MQNSNDRMAQSFYLAQLQACKGKCQCNVCKLLRQASDQMTEQLIKGDGKSEVGIEEAMSTLAKAGYDVSPPGAREGDR